MKNNKIIMILVAIFIILTAVSIINTASAASITSIDKNSVMLNKKTTFNWEAKSYSNDKVVVTEIKSNEFRLNTVTTTIETNTANDLKITTLKVNKNLSIYPIEISNDTQVKYVNSTLNPKNYYFKVFKSSMIKNVPSKIKVDSRITSLKKDLKTTLKYNTILYKNGKVIVSQKYSGKSVGGNKAITIESYKTNKLKITTNYLTGTPDNKKVNYVSTKHLPKEYYFNVFKVKMDKGLVTKGYFDGGRIYNKKNMSMWIEWNAKVLKNSSVLFVAWEKPPVPGAGCDVIFEKYRNNKLKIYYHQGGTYEAVITYVNTKYSPKDYYLKVYKIKKTFPYNW